ncbi:very low-density lipoprotein receptor-like [Manduca sexta]|uniref:Sushi domain-containing protein n=1 Tax=Manduca sexta TaxID=7130 RepID=A0A922CZN6_MANSE|nr:very low-density lipoprotein receptor-like [Manduca sexta]KAG6463173.1 hypothetical protein O3G_MSEX013717 [Manduca sexta]
MYTDLFFIVLATVPALTSVLKEEINYCSPDEFSCGDGSCVSFSAFCDGKRDCFNGADEACTIGENALSTDTVLNRSRRQLSNCRISQWQCKDGSCINFDGKCDGIVDCPDASDETHALCRERQCQYNWFRCTYGACVDGTAPCNGVQDCADNSDELLPRCRNETEEIRGQFKCLDGRFIAAYKHCDGVADCADGSDETLRSCAGKTCLSYLFQCAYGACVDKDSDCNGIRECVDGSDEADDLCADRNTSVQPVKEGACVLPEYPEHGGYVVSGMKNAKPGMSFEFVSLNYTCNKGYGILGRNDVTCTNGWWNFTPLPKCTRFCHLKEHVSVEYKCVLSGSSQGFRTCNEYEPDGTLVQPECRKPNYYSETTFRYMSCIGAVGAWNYVAKCIPGLVKNGTNITVIVKDKVEVFVSNFQYASPNSSSENNVEYAIDEGDWRIGTVTKPQINGQAGVVRPYGENNDDGIPHRLPVRPSDKNNILEILQRLPTATTQKNNNIDVPVAASPNITNPANINFNIINSTVFVTQDPYKDKIFFRD